jgi:Zn-dependent peptidase ImmA (M78 family)/DNA-binding XRE family transcriptional regulator
VDLSSETIGARLQTARRAVDLTQTEVGKRVGMATSTVSAIEAGKRSVTGPELAAFARMYQRSPAYFLEEEEPFQAPGFQYLFRAASEKSLDRPSIALVEQLADDYDALERLTDVHPLPPPPSYAHLGLSRDQDAETLAEMERGRLGLGDGPVRDLMNLFDGTAGVRCFMVPVDGQAWSGLAVRDRWGRPCIAVNSKEEPYRRNSTWAHEYGHVLVDLGQNQTPEGHVDEQRLGRSVRADERFVNAFASAFLMPRRAVFAEVEKVLDRRSGRFSNFDLVHLAITFGVSGQAMSARLVTLRLLPRDVHEEYWSRNTFKADATALGFVLDDRAFEKQVVFSDRYRYLAGRAFEQGLISLAKFAEFLREDYHALRERPGLTNLATEPTD